MAMKRANISQLKNKLSAFVAEARAGETVLILDRQTPVARLVPLEGGQTLTVQEAKRPVSALRKIRRISLRKPVDVIAMLREDRDGR